MSWAPEAGGLRDPYPHCPRLERRAPQGHELCLPSCNRVAEGEFEGAGLLWKEWKGVSLHYSHSGGVLPGGVGRFSVGVKILSWCQTLPLGFGWWGLR